MSGFLYWYFGVRSSKKTPTPPTTGTTTATTTKGTTGTTTSTTTKGTSTPVFQVDLKKEAEISTLEEITPLIKDFLKENYPEDKFTELALKDLTLQQFFNATNVSTPIGFYSKVEQNFTLFVYSSKTRKRLGFIVNISDQNNFKEMIEDWEETMVKDFQSFFLSLEEIEVSSLSNFKTASSQGKEFRYITLNNDYGICWAVINNKFIFTTSGGSMIEVLKKID